MASDAMERARRAIEGRLQERWAATPVAWPMVDFAPPDDGAWLQVAILWGDGFEATMGGTNTIVGVLQLSLYGRPGAGLGPLTRLADEARALFNRADLGGVRFGAASGPRVGPDEAWAQMIVSISFEVEESVSPTGA